jgi:catechol 2,3-dioxygenase-like lactoylglutathione lyase family enzyme
MIHGIDHTAISVPDLDAAVAFYCETLGFTVESESGWPVGAKRVDRLVGFDDSSARVVMIRLGQTRIELFQYLSPEPRWPSSEFRVCDFGLTHICLSVTEIESEVARLSAEGVLFNSAPLDVGTAYCVYGRDPFGNVLELKQPK